MNGASRWLDAWTAPAAASSAAAQARASGVWDQSLRFMRFSSLVAERPARAQDAPVAAAPEKRYGPGTKLDSGPEESPAHPFGPVARTVEEWIAYRRICMLDDKEVRRLL